MDLETILHVNEATKASRKRKQSNKACMRAFAQLLLLCEDTIVNYGQFPFSIHYFRDAHALLRSKMHQERLSGGRRVKSFVLLISHLG